MPAAGALWNCPFSSIVFACFLADNSERNISHPSASWKKRCMREPCCPTRGHPGGTRENVLCKPLRGRRGATKAFFICNCCRPAPRCAAAPQRDTANITPAEKKGKFSFHRAGGWTGVLRGCHRGWLSSCLRICPRYMRLQKRNLLRWKNSNVKML